MIKILNPVVWGGHEIARTLRAQYWKNNIRNFVPREDGFKANAILYKDMNGQHIRKLTPSECYRLMDMDEENIQKIVNAKDEKGKQLISDTQMYSTAGNGIAVACLEYIFHNLFIGTDIKDKADKDGQLSLF